MNFQSLSPSVSPLMLKGLPTTSMKNMRTILRWSAGKGPYYRALRPEPNPEDLSGGTGQLP